MIGVRKPKDPAEVARELGAELQRMAAAADLAGLSRLAYLIDEAAEQAAARAGTRGTVAPEDAGGAPTMTTARDTAGKAAFIARMLASLEEIAASDRNLPMLAYLIAVAREEAEARMKSPKG